MKHYFAPMEGITGYIYRNAYHTFWSGVDKYFTPFISLTQSSKGYKKQLKDILPENNQGLTIVPQILTNKSQDFIEISKGIRGLGYEEINLNLGCPSGTVVAKNKGAGFLSQPEKLDAFLEEIFAASITKISLKTRIGKEEPEEFYRLIEIFNQYPLEELIIHPRVQKDYYNNKPNMVIFREAVKSSKNPIGYNGDIFTVEDYEKLVKEYPQINSVMLGRGFLRNPSLIEQICTAEETVDNNNIDNNIMGDIHDMKKVRAFHDRIYEDYRSVMSGDVPTLYKMKELWSYMIHLFPDSEKDGKRIRKADKLQEYEGIVNQIFERCRN